MNRFRWQKGLPEACGSSKFRRK